MPILADPQSLSAAATCFRCLDGAPHNYVTAYLMGQWSPTASTDPQVLVAASALYQRFGIGGIVSGTTYLLARLAGGSLDPNQLSLDARCFECLLPEYAAVQNYLLSALITGTNDPQTLLTLAAPFQAIPEGYLGQIVLYVLSLKAGVGIEELAGAIDCFRCLAGEHERIQTFLLATMAGEIPSLVLFHISQNFVGWTWGVVNPDHWVFEKSTTANGPWTFLDSQPGASRGPVLEGDGVWVRMYGANAAGVRITEISNSVFSPFT